MRPLVQIGRPETPPYLVTQIEELATNTDLSINKIRTKIKESASRVVVGQIVKRVRDEQVASKKG